MNWNSLFIAVGTGTILWVLKLILAAVMYLVNTLPPMQADVTTLKEDVKSLRASTATKTELADAEKRVKLEFQEQLKRGRIITNQNRQP